MISVQGGHVTTLRDVGTSRQAVMLTLCARRSLTSSRHDTPAWPRVHLLRRASIHPLLVGWSRDHHDDDARNTAASFSLLEHRYALVKLAAVFAQVGIGRQRMRDVRPVSCITFYNVRYRS